MAMPGGYAPQQSGSYMPQSYSQSTPQGNDFGIPSQQTTQQQPQQGGTPPQQQPQQQLSREDYRDKWMSSGVKDQAGLTNFLNQYGGTQLSGNGTVKTPYGDDVIDMLIGARSGGNGQPGWTGLPGMSQSQVTPWNGQSGGQQSGGFYNGPQNGNNWLMQLLQQYQNGGQMQQQPRGQDMPYNNGQHLMDRGGAAGTPRGPLSDYFKQYMQQGSPQGNEWWNGQGSIYPGGSSEPGGLTGQGYGNWHPPQPGDMINNGWGGKMPYDPNSQAIT